MTAIAGFTYTPDVHQVLVTDKFRQVKCTMAFGNGSLTYPTGGIPVDFTQLGFRNAIRSVVITDPANANGYVYKWDDTNQKIRIYQGAYLTDSAADNALIELTTAATPAATTLIIEATGT